MPIKTGVGFGVGFDTGDSDFITTSYNPNGAQPKREEPVDPVFTCSGCGFRGHPLLFVVAAGEVACPMCRVDPRTGKRHKQNILSRIRNALAALKG